jgi:hypothetical protein
VAGDKESVVVRVDTERMNMDGTRIFGGALVLGDRRVIASNAGLGGG